MAKERKIMAFVVYPGISLLELVGTRSLLSSIAYNAGFDSVVVAERVETTATDTPLAIIPQKSFAEVPQPEGLVVIGGGASSLRALRNPDLIAYIQKAGQTAELVASVSTGSLLLGEAGLLKGRQATTHWAYADRLNEYGASYVQQPWIQDGRITTAAGVSGGIDMAIGLGASMTSQKAARLAQLMIEYDPHPPFGKIDWAQVNREALAPLMEQQGTPEGPIKDIAFVIYPDLTVFDLVGPLQVISALSRIAPQFRPVVVSEQPGPVSTDIGVQMIPNCTLDELPHPAGFVVPGGDAATLQAMNNPAIRKYVRAAAGEAEWVVSVCTGALILAGVGLLRGCEVTTHWAYRRYLQNLGARYVQKRWTHNGKIINSAGVSAGIEMALYLAKQMTDEETARKVQLMIQYDPEPPFGGIDYKHLELMPRLMRSANGLRSYLYTNKALKLTRQGL